MESSEKEETVPRSCDRIKSWRTHSTISGIPWTIMNTSRYTTRNIGIMPWITNHRMVLILFYIIYCAQIIMADGHASSSQLNSDLRAGSQSNSLTLCTDDTCRNGQCYVVGMTTKCYCNSIFRGSHCEIVDFDQISVTIIGSMVIFQWSRPPRINGYSFVYYELDNPRSILYKADIIMGSNEHASLVGNLKGGHTTYRVCIEDQIIADKVVRHNSMEYLSNCITLTTQTDYATLAAFFIAAMLACVAVMFIYLQKDKLEILYFSRPVFLAYQHPVNDEENKSPQEPAGHPCSPSGTVTNCPVSNHAP